MPGFTLRTIRCPMATRFDPFSEWPQTAALFLMTKAYSQSPMPGFTLQHTSVGSVSWSSPHQTQEPDGGIHSYVSGAVLHANKPLRTDHRLRPFPIRSVTAFGHPRFIRGMLPSKNTHFKRFAGAVQLSSHLLETQHSGLRLRLRSGRFAGLRPSSAHPFGTRGV